MPRHDWLVGRDRRSAAAERIYAAAAELIARRGSTPSPSRPWRRRSTARPRRSTDMPAAKLYPRRRRRRPSDAHRRHSTPSHQRPHRFGSSGDGHHRRSARPAIGRLAHLMQSMHETPISEWITAPAVNGFAAEMLGLEEDDPIAAQWRLLFGTVVLPAKDPDAQRAMLQRFLGPPYSTDC